MTHRIHSSSPLLPSPSLLSTELHVLGGEESRRAGSSKGEVGNIGELGRSDRDPRRDLHGVEEPRGRGLWVTGEEHQDLACTVGVAGEERPGDHAGEERSWATVGAHQRGEKLRTEGDPSRERDLTPGRRGAAGGRQLQQLSRG
jgi:hypothetical protein